MHSNTGALDHCSVLHEQTEDKTEDKTVNVQSYTAVSELLQTPIYF